VSETLGRISRIYALNSVKPNEYHLFRQGDRHWASGVVKDGAKWNVSGPFAVNPMVKIFSD
jgi:hypothetical protein